jgi:hypothetical protein
VDFVTTEVELTSFEALSLQKTVIVLDHSTKLTFGITELLVAQAVVAV